MKSLIEAFGLETEAQLDRAIRTKSWQPKTGAACGCRPGVQRDNCPNCEGTGQVIDFRAIRAGAAK